MTKPSGDDPPTGGPTPPSSDDSHPTAPVAPSRSKAVGSTDEDSSFGESAAVRSHLRRISTLFGGVAGLASIVYVYGYLADSSLYGLAGLPMLSVDYQTTLESGGIGLVNAVGVLFEGTLRNLAIMLIVAAAITGLCLIDRSVRLQRFVASPLACISSQIVILGLFLGSLLGLLDIARLADTGQRDIVSRQVGEEVTALAQKTKDDSGVTAWSPVAEAELIARASYPATGLYSPIQYLFESRTIQSESKQRLRTVQGASASSTYFLRRNVVDRENARDLFGWIFLTVVLLIALSTVVIRWRKLLDRPTVEARTTGWDAFFPQERVSQVSRWILSPSLTVMIMLNASLLPVASGILTRSAVGEEQVSIRLQESCVGRLPQVQTSGPPSAGSLDVDALADLVGELGPDAMAYLGSDSVASLNSMIESDVSSSALAAKRSSHRSTATLSPCGDESRTHVDTLSNGILQATRGVLQERNHPTDAEEAKVRYRRAVDALIDWTLETRCTEGLTTTERHLPLPGLYRLAPEAAEYYLGRWKSLQAIGNTRSGFLLRYPRSDSDEPVYLFNALTDWDVLNDSRWLVDVIPRSCVAQISVVPDLRTLSARNMTSKPEKDAWKQVQEETHPVVIESLLDSLDDEADMLTSVSMLTSLAMDIGPIANSDPELLMRSVDALLELALDERQAASRRSAAMTALHSIGSPYAATQFANRATEILEAPPQMIGVTATSAGFMGTSYDHWRDDMGLPSGDTTSESIRGFLDAIATNPSLDPDIRGAAITGLGIARYRSSASILRDVLEDPDSPMALLGVAVSNVGDLHYEEGRESLKRLFEDVGVREDIRRAALGSLYQLGLFEEASTLLDRLFDPYEDADFTSELLRFLEDVDPDVTAATLIDCVKDPSQKYLRRRLCTELLSLLDSDYNSEQVPLALAELMPRGDETPLADFEPDVEELRTDVCWTLADYALRGAHEARRLVEESERCRPTIEQLENAPRPHPGSPDYHIRWHKFLVFAEQTLKELAGDTVGRSAPAFALPTSAGDRVRVEPEKEGQVLLLDFTASWCSPCIEAAPLLADLNDRYASEEFRMVTVTAEEDLSDALAFVEEHNGSLPVFHDVDQEVSRLYGADSLPTFVIIGKDGRIRRKQSGYRDIDSLGRRLRHEIESAIAE